MKYFHTILLLPLLTGCFATKVGLDNPGQPGLVTLKLGPIKVEKIEGEVGHNEHSDMTEKSKLFKFDQSGWITSFNPSMRNERGDILPSGIIHHAAAADHGENDYLCKDLPHKARLMLAAGSELTSFKMPEGFGIPISKEMEIALVGMFNTKSSFGGKAYFTGQVGFTPKTKETQLKDITPIWIDVVENCDPMGYKVFSSSSGMQTKDRKFKFPFNGELRVAGGHMHSGGKRLSILEEESGKVLVSFEPEYDDKGNLERIPLKNLDDKVQIKANTSYVIRSEYLPNSHHDIDAMGIVIAFVTKE